MTDRRNGNGRRALDGDHMLSDVDIARMAQVSPNTVRFWRQSGILPFEKMGKYPRVWLSVFNRLFQKPLPPSSGAADTMPSAGDIRRPL